MGKKRTWTFTAYSLLMDLLFFEKRGAIGHLPAITYMGAKNLKWVKCESCFCRISRNTIFYSSLDYWKSQRLGSDTYTQMTVHWTKKTLNGFQMVMSQPCLGGDIRRLQSWKQEQVRMDANRKLTPVCVLSKFMLEQDFIEIPSFTERNEKGWRGSSRAFACRSSFTKRRMA